MLEAVLMTIDRLRLYHGHRDDGGILGMVSLASSLPILSDKSLPKGRTLEHQIAGPRHDVSIYMLQVSHLPLDT